MIPSRSIAYNVHPLVGMIRVSCSRPAFLLRTMEGDFKNAYDFCVFSAQSSCKPKTSLKK